MKKPKAYLHFKEIPELQKPKTKVYAIYSNATSTYLGYIQWYSPWRKYCFYCDYGNLIFDNNCLNEISNYLQKLNINHKENKK
jgi:hypothetical protein